MSDKIIPEHIDPFRFAEQKISLEGSLSVSEMQRLSTNLKSNKANVFVKLNFGIDEQGLTFITGELQTNLVLECQRCLETFMYPVASQFRLGIVRTLDEANALPKHYEPAIAQENNLALRDLIEDEIILNLPIIPRHEPQDCNVKLPLADAGWQNGKDDNNPFQVLEALKKCRRDKENESR